MKLYIVNLLCIGLIFLPFPSYGNDRQIKELIIQESISSYSGNCPCPYNTMRNGRSCGKRSAYSRPGGASPICYESDITKTMIESYKKRKKR
jgi:hypothetical protein